MVSHRTTIGWNKNIAYLKSYISENDFTACMDRRVLYKGFSRMWDMPLQYNSRSSSHTYVNETSLPLVNYQGDSFHG